jgi:hypothetical protein
MDPDPLEVIADGCWLALRFGLRVSPVPTGNLRVVEGVYSLGAGKTYHPLEAALVGVAPSGDWREDVATALGVDARWVSGLLDGFAQESESSTPSTFRAFSPPSSCAPPATRGTCPTDDDRPRRLREAERALNSRFVWSINAW